MLLHMVYLLFSLNTVRMTINRLVAYASRSLTETDQKYSQNKREALAILFGFSRFQVCLFGKTF